MSTAADSQRPCRIFLSYSRQDRRHISKLAALLETAGFSVWWDTQVRSGARFAHTLEQELHRADRVIVAWSKDAIQSDWVMDEASFARDHNKLMPITIDGTLPPLGFRQIHASALSPVEFRGDSPAYLEFVSRIDQRSESDTKLPGPPKNSDKASARRSSTRLWLTAAAVLALLGTAAIGSLWWNGRSEPPAAATAKVAVGLAVLPFENLTEDSSLSEFVAGLNEELLTSLSAVRGLAIPARTTAAQFQGGSTNLAKVSEVLGAKYALIGSVRGTPEKMRIAIQLVETGNGFLLWSSTYNTDGQDLIRMQDEISAEVTSELLGEIPEDLESFSELLPGVASDSHQEYLAGRALWANRETRQAMDRFSQATKLDSNHWLAQAYLAVTAVQHSAGFRAKEAAAMNRLIDTALTQAISKQPDHPEVLFARAWVMEARSQEGRGVLSESSAISLLRDVLRANPRHVEALHMLSRAEMLPQHEQVSLLESVLKIEPGHYSAFFNLTQLYARTGRPEAARSLILKTQMAAPEMARSVLALAAKMAGDINLATDIAFRDWDDAKLDPQLRRMRAAFLADMGKRDLAALLYDRETGANAQNPEVNPVGAARLRGNLPRQLELTANLHAKSPKPWISYMYAKALLENGQFERALEVMLAARPDLDSDQIQLVPVGWNLLTYPEETLTAYLFLKTGNNASAERLWQTLLHALEEQNTGSWSNELAIALVQASLGKVAQGHRRFRNARESGFRFLCSFASNAFVDTDLLDMKGIFEVFRDIPDIGDELHQIATQNGQLFEQLEQRYGLIAKIQEKEVY